MIKVAYSRLSDVFVHSTMMPISDVTIFKLIND